ncbi:hypothetical protein MGYG_00217 [Nannizzia gypsea CBS 118893]|uniref:Uncharacterized protein n=1 Tax=Arthroderma gypseum (strain ATCC MYA-4604 / CBS 118893) TaxID=535722 RepID=E5R3P9_ARTGP|nr:hypothetical protein MGYG_00217 [Nannizzia gypsea CBS 118893]EFQ97173.1 hypothetical protein MGYG_00217 [Nannizzia gypsea CBS 118893]
MDVYIRAEDDYTEFSQYLLSNEGYKRTPSRHQTTPYAQDVESFYRHGSERTVRIIGTTHMPIEALLHESYTTACLNIITWNKAYCLFPRLTLARGKSYLLKDMDENFGKLLEEYEFLGWPSGNMLWANIEEVEDYLLQTRTIGGNSLIVRLARHDLCSPRKPDQVIEYSQFQLQKSVYNDIFLCPTPTKFLSSCALRHTYLLTSSHWESFVKKRLHMIAAAELYKIQPRSRSDRATRALNADFIHLDEWPGLETTQPTKYDHINRPDTWTYADCLIREWYSQWAKNPQS